MIVGGISARTKMWKPHNITRLIDLSDETRSCKNLGDFPIPMSGGTGAVVSGSPMICGFENETEHIEQCYLMDLKKKSWTFLTNMTTERRGSSSVAINGSLFVTGGRGIGDKILSSTEYITPNGSVTSGPGMFFSSTADQFGS